MFTFPLSVKRAAQAREVAAYTTLTAWYRVNRPPAGYAWSRGGSFEVV